MNKQIKVNQRYYPTFPHTPSNGTVLDKKLKSGKWDAKVFIRSILWLAPRFI